MRDAPDGLVLISQYPRPAAWDPDTESVGETSEVEVEDVDVESVPELPIPSQDRVHGVQHVFATLDIVNIAEVFAQRARVTQSVPWVIRGGNARDSGRHQGEQRVESHTRLEVAFALAEDDSL